jgi:hypothetical protein
MDIRWTRSNVVLLTLLMIAITAVGALSALVVHQQHNQSAIHGQIYLGPASAADAPSKESAAAPVITPANPDALAGPNPAANPAPAAAPLPKALTPDPVNAPAIPAPQAVPVPPAPQVVAVPAVVPAPHLNPVPQLPRKPLPQKTQPHRQTHPLAPPPQPVPAQPAIPPATAPDPDQTPTKREIFDKAAASAGSEEKGGPEGTPDSKPSGTDIAKKPQAPEAVPPGPPATKMRMSRPSWTPTAVDMPKWGTPPAPATGATGTPTKGPRNFPW